MAVITSPPILIGTTGTPMCPDSGFWGPGVAISEASRFNLGPFSINGELYLVGISTDLFSPGAIRVSKSTDGGSTWAYLNNAGSVTTNEAIEVIVDGATLHIIYTVFSGSAATRFLRVIDFDCNTDTYGAAQTVSTIAPSGTPTFFVAALKPSNGDIYIFYSDGTAGNTPPNLSQYTVYDGTWAAPVRVSPATNPQSECIQSVAIDAAEIIHIVLTRLVAFNREDLIYKNLDTVTDTLSSETIIDASNDATNLAIGCGKCSIQGTTLIIPAPRGPQGDGSGGWPLIAGYYEGTGLPAPTFSAWTLLDTEIGNVATALGIPVGTGLRDLYIASFVDTGGEAFIVWAMRQLSGIYDPWLSIYYCSRTGGGWSVPIHYYDEIANPQTDDPSVLPIDQAFHAITLNRLAGQSQPIIATALEQNGVDCSEYLLLPESDLSITCDDPPTGTVGTAYSHFFPVTGGTEPYTWSISAGALPTGLSLNTATGEVSGTPTTAGVFGFAVTVTDSAGGSVAVLTDLVTATPEVVDAAVEARSKDGGAGIGSNYYGPWENGGEYYLALWVRVPPSSGATRSYIAVYKSPDGVTWTEQDALNHPLYRTGSGDQFYSILSSDGFFIYCSYILPDASAVSIIAFDVSTDTWGTPFAGPTRVTGAGTVTAHQIVEQDSGDLIIFYNRTPGAVNDLYYARYTGTAIGAETKFNTDFAAAIGNAYQGFLARSGFIHVFYASGGTSSNYRRLVDDGTKSAAVALGSTFDCAGDPQVWGTSIIVPGLVPSSGAGSAPAVAIGDSLSTPTFTVTAVAPDEEDAKAFVSAIIDGTSAWIAWYRFTSASPDNISYMALAQCCTPGADWNDQVTFWNQITNPQTDQPVFTGESGGHTIRLISNGTFRGAATIYGDTFSAVYSLISSTTAASISSCGINNEDTVECSIRVFVNLSCNNPPGGTVGEAYDHFITVAGGVAPYTFSITDGALPAGLSLNATTGEITGTPTSAGTYSFDVSVEDSADNCEPV